MSVPSHFSILHTRFLSRTVELLKPQTAVSLPLDASVRQGLERLKEHPIGCVVLLDKDGKLAGIFTERDALKRVALANFDLDAVPVSQVMTANPQTIKKNASVARALHLMSAGGFRHVPVIYPGESALGLLSVKTIVDYIYRTLTRKVADFDMVVADTRNTVDQFFASSVKILVPHKPVTVLEDASLRTVLEILGKLNIGSVVVLDHHHKISGIFTERDYLFKVATAGVDCDSTPISALMTPKPHTILDSASVSLAFNLMSEGGYRHIPVVDGGENLIGVVSARNFIDYLTSQILSELGKAAK